MSYTLYYYYSTYTHTHSCYVLRMKNLLEPRAHVIQCVVSTSGTNDMHEKKKLCELVPRGQSYIINKD